MLDLITTGLESTVAIENASELFSPVLANIYAEVKSGQWMRIGRIRPGEIERPVMINGHVDPNDKCSHMWFLIHWDRDER